MKCPYCGFPESKVTDSRPTQNSIKRRRECLSCKKRFTTFEEIEHLQLIVIKKDKSRQPFSKEKLLNSFLSACHKRPIPTSVLKQAVDEIEIELLNDMETEVSYARIGELALNKIKKIDDIAYVRFASVYKQYKNAEAFMAELQKILEEIEDNNKTPTDYIN